jgi:hypothetical protein
VTGADISPDALAVARINVDKHGLQTASRCSRVRWLLAALPGPFDLILCNPPYVNAAQHGALPAEYQAEPVLALAGGQRRHGLCATLLRRSARLHGEPGAVLVLEIGNERPTLKRRFPTMKTLKNVTLRRGAKVLLDNGAPPSPSTPAKRSAWSGATAPANPACSPCSTAVLLHEDRTRATYLLHHPPNGAWARWRRTCPRPSKAPPTSWSRATPRCWPRSRKSPMPKPATTAWRMAHAYMDLHDAGAHDAPARAQALILGLGFKTTELDNPVNSFSGGWRMRLQLARALMCPSDLLLLDEPTNHLDLDALVWLEAWLKRYEGTMIVISHDREFLDA